MALYCKFGNSGPDGSDSYYICSADQHCCEIDQCCYASNRYNLPQLWYCWFLVLTGILICSLISGKFCKKRHSVRRVTVASSRVPAHDRPTGTATIVHPSTAMGNVWTVFPPGYNSSSFVVTDSTTRVHDYSSSDYSSSTSSEGYRASGDHPTQPPLQHTEAMYPPGVSLSYHPSMGNVYPHQPGYNTVIITDTLYEGEPPSYESVMRSQAHPRHPDVVPAN